MRPLIDATEMYLRTVWELEEEGITPIRARLVERLQVSAPAVSETVARLEAEGLMRMLPDRRLELTDRGREIATSVMRKHRLAELLLTEVIGLEWEEAHNEACKWEHVISDRVEERLVALLGAPAESPFGNPIPSRASFATWNDLLPASEAAKSGRRGTIERISERLQVDVDAMRGLRASGIRPGVGAALRRDGDAVVARLDGGDEVRLDRDTADHLYVRVDA